MNSQFEICHSEGWKNYFRFLIPFFDFINKTGATNFSQIYCRFSFFVSLPTVGWQFIAEGY